MNTTIPRLCILLALSAFQGSAKAQCQSQGPLSATVFSDDNATGVYAFGSPSSAASSDDNRASASAIISVLSGNTHYLKVTGFNFSVPATAGICGILVEVEKSASNTSILATVTDDAVRLVKGGVVTGNNYATGDEWPGTDSYYSYGGNADLWGAGWTPADVNAADFGVVFSAQINGLISLLPSARIDHIRVTVFYNDPLPVHFTGFDARSMDGNTVLLQWTTADNDEEVGFTVQRSPDGRHWTGVHSIMGGISPEIREYRYQDPAPPHADYCYYRVRMEKHSGMILYTSVAWVRLKKHAGISVYPNPASGKVTIGCPAGARVRILDISGRVLPLRAIATGFSLVTFDLAGFSPGYYILEVNGERVKLLKKP